MRPTALVLAVLLSCATSPAVLAQDTTASQPERAERGHGTKRRGKKQRRRANRRGARRRAARARREAARRTTTEQAEGVDSEVISEGGEKVKVMRFSGLDISGRLKSPQLLYFLNRMRAEFDRPRLPHRSFMGELERSTRRAPF